MATDSTKAAVAVTGAVFKGLTTATAPTGTGGATTGFTDFGWIGEDGVEVSLPDAGDTTAIKGWQNGATVRVVRTPSDDSPTYTFTILETNVQAVETYFGVTVTQTATEGSFTYTVSNRGYNSYIIDAVDGAELRRDYLPYGIVSSVDSHSLTNGDITGYRVTISAERSPTLNYNVKSWNTRLKS